MGYWQIWPCVISHFPPWQLLMWPYCPYLSQHDSFDLSNKGTNGSFRGRICLSLLRIHPDLYSKILGISNIRRLVVLVSSLFQVSLLFFLVLGLGTFHNRPLWPTGYRTYSPPRAGTRRFKCKGNPKTVSDDRFHSFLSHEKWLVMSLTHIFP